MLKCFIKKAYKNTGYIYIYISLDNIAFKKPAWLHYPYPDRPWGADRAVGGLYSNLTAFGGQCVISSDKQSRAEW